MTKLKSGLAIGVGLAMISATALAGLKQPFLVDVDLVGMIASGDMLSARRGDAGVFIGCNQRHVADGSGGALVFGFCQAQDAGGDKVFCSSDNEDLLSAINSISESSWISFSWSDDGTGLLTCNRISISTQSFYMGRHVLKNPTP